VLDLSRLLPGPFCSLVLSDLGASVDKLEDPHAGDYLRIYPGGWPISRHAPAGGRYAALNRDKRSLCLDLKKPEGRAALLQLLPRYDVLLESFRPGVLARLGLDDAALWAANPKLTLCAISGYPVDGPFRDRAGHDLNCVALAGVVGLSGPSDGAPPVPPVQIADFGGGALHAAIGILAGLYDAQRSGRGRKVDVSMCEGALGFLLPAFGDLALTGELPSRGQDMLTGGAAQYGIYRTKDDRYFSVAALEPKFWQAFNDALGRVCDPSELMGGAAAQARLRDEIQTIIAKKTRDEWTQIFAPIDACCEPVLEPAEAAQHPLHARAFVDIDGRAYPTTALHRLGARTTHTPAPTQGQHSAEILREAGLAEDQIAALRTAGVTR
jgi:crotonobetainyl-CoA:carnitine CoA-transferase CaiB-like acyl-CoA transferase